MGSKTDKRTTPNSVGGAAGADGGVRGVKGTGFQLQDKQVLARGEHSSQHRAAEATVAKRADLKCSHPKKESVQMCVATDVNQTCRGDRSHHIHEHRVTMSYTFSPHNVTRPLYLDEK